jgi:hypothetical protein
VPDSAVLTVTVIFPGVDVAVYDVITEPPLKFGFVYDMFIDPLAACVALPIVGAPGTPNTNPNSP